MTRTFFPALLALAAWLAGGMPAPAQTPTNAPPGIPRRPNIILIVADGLGCDDLGCYGHGGANTPILDQMAAEGVRFSSFYAGSPYKFPARESLLTGRDAGHLGAPSDTEVFLPNNGPIVAEVLKNAGYRTGCVGEWGLAGEGSPNVPQQRGFQEWAGFYTDAEADAEYPTYIWRYDPSRAGLPGYEGKVELSQNENHPVQPAADLFTTAAINYAKIHRPDQFNHYQPFFLFVGYPLPRGGKTDAIARLDTDIGLILDGLKAQKIESNTMVFVTSDTSSWKKGNRATDAGDGLREPGMRVPLIAWCPGRIKAGEENYLPTAAYDLLPTFAEIGRAEKPDICDGISFLQPLLGGPQLNRHDFLYWQIHPAGGLQQAARMGDWKAEYTPGQAVQLFSVLADRAEKTDLAKDHPDVVRQFEDYFKSRQPKP